MPDFMTTHWVARGAPLPPPVGSSTRAKVSEGVPQESAGHVGFTIENVTYFISICKPCVVCPYLHEIYNKLLLYIYKHRHFTYHLVTLIQSEMVTCKVCVKEATVV